MRQLTFIFVSHRTGRDFAATGHEKSKQNENVFKSANILTNKKFCSIIYMYKESTERGIYEIFNLF